MTQIMLAAPSRMIAMRMRDHSFFYRLPGIDVEITGSTVQALIGKLDKQGLNLVINKQMVCQVCTMSGVRCAASLWLKFLL